MSLKLKMNNPIGVGLVIAAGAYLVYRGSKKLMTKDNEQIDYIARTAWGEARSEGKTGMQAVINVIMNRVNAGAWYGATPKEVVLKKWQFSCWNENDPNRLLLMAVDERDKNFATAKELATLAYNGQLPDITDGALGYYNPDVIKNYPYDVEYLGQIGNHIFWKE